MNCHKSLLYVALLETEWLFSSLPESKRTNFRTLSKNIRISFINCQLENEFSIRSRLVMHCNSNIKEIPSLIFYTLLENSVIESAFFLVLVVLCWKRPVRCFVGTVMTSWSRPRWRRGDRHSTSPGHLTTRWKAGGTHRRPLCWNCTLYSVHGTV